jgi:hypothetical protein
MQCNPAVELGPVQQGVAGNQITKGSATRHYDGVLGLGAGVDLHPALQEPRTPRRRKAVAVRMATRQGRRTGTAATLSPGQPAAEGTAHQCRRRTFKCADERIAPVCARPRRRGCASPVPRTAACESGRAGAWRRIPGSTLDGSAGREGPP